LGWESDPPATALDNYKYEPVLEENPLISAIRDGINILLSLIPGQGRRAIKIGNPTATKIFLQP
jgi:hypothetical protein